MHKPRHKDGNASPANVKATPLRVSASCDAQVVRSARDRQRSAGAQASPSASKSFPRKLERQKRTAHGAALTLTVAVAFIGELQATPLRVFLEAARHSPCAIGAALFPAAL